ncbi:ribonuclease H-like domain-containing protein [Tanacetum coccineum]
MWLFKHKFYVDGTLSRYKARLVANGSSQQLGVDFDETFSSVVKAATIRTVLSLVVSRKCPIHQLDVKNSFLNGDLSETVYMHQSPGFVDSRYPHHVCLLQRSLYGLKQAPRAWFQRFVGYATRAGFSHKQCDSSLFIYTQGSQNIDSLHKEFDMTDLGALNNFLGKYATRHSTGLIPLYTATLSGELYYLTFTRLDLSYAVQQICHYMHDPREPHLAALKRILRYVQGNREFGLHLYASATTSLVGYTDAGWAGCPSTCRSTSGYCVFLGDNLLSWSFKRQHTISPSSVEAEYRGVANVIAETAWIRNLLRELHSPFVTAILVDCDDLYADIFTKRLPSALFEDFHSSLSVRPPPAQTTGAYSQLLSDMKAFKGANPGCISVDFVRWHSPPDWMEPPLDDESKEYVVGDSMSSIGSAKKELTEGMIDENLQRTNFLTACYASLSPSTKLSSMPTDLFSLVTLYITI